MWTLDRPVNRTATYEGCKVIGGGGGLEGYCALMSLLISYGLQPLNQMALINESTFEAVSE